MFGKDLVFILYWWILLFALGALVFPITFFFFEKFWDRGWAFTKIVGFGLLAYFVWIVGSLHLLAFKLYTIWLGISFLVYGSYLLLGKTGINLQDFFKKRWRLVVFEEIIFGILLAFWAWVRAHQPDINGLEKFMDFGFVNSILRSEFFPPRDMWLTPESINYYYFGHLVIAVLTKLSGLSSAITYNLMLGTILALSFVAAFSLGAMLFEQLMVSKKRSAPTFLLFLAGLISAAVFDFGGNLHTVYKVLTKGSDAYWYPDATRFIPFTIHEFPLYSFVVSDLHGHVNNIPFVLLTLALLFSTLLVLRDAKFRPDFSLIATRLGALGLLTGMLFVTNAMDAPIYLLVMGFSFLLISLLKLPFVKSVLYAAFATAGVAVLGFIFSLPFQLSFVPFTKGVDLVHTRSAFWQLLVLWGFFAFVGAVFIVLLFLERSRKAARNKNFSPIVSRFMLAIIGVSTLLVIIPEVVYIKDIYIEDYHRANTMFKLVYQTFMMMSVLSGPIFVALVRTMRIQNSLKLRLFLFLLVLVFILGLGSVLSYPYFAIRSYYNRLQVYMGLDGLSWMAQRYPDDYASVVWLQKNVGGQAVILEAVGESYTDFARVSANTGLTTVLGWRVHEWLWRGSFDEAGRRTNDVATLYTSSEVRDVCQLVNKYEIDYIFVGSLERQQYPMLSDASFGSLGSVVFYQGDTTIYQLNRPCAVF